MLTAVIDTNYLIRLITRDIPDFADRAAQDITSLPAGSILLPDAVLAEVAVVLKVNKHYQYPRDIITEALQGLGNIKQLALSDAARLALDLFAQTNLDFVDCLVIAERQHKNLSRILSFDGPLQRTADKYKSLA